MVMWLSSDTIILYLCIYCNCTLWLREYYLAWVQCKVLTKSRCVWTLTHKQMDRCTDRHAQLPLCVYISTAGLYTLQAYIGNTCLHNHHGITGAMLSEWDAAGSVCAGVCTHGKPSQIHIWRGVGRRCLLSESAVSYMIICSEYKKRIACQTKWL